MEFIKLGLISVMAFLPAGLANMAPVFAKRLWLLDPLNVPLDAGKTFRGKRIFGPNKTVRGLVAGFGFAVVGVAIQRLLDTKVCISCLGYANAINSVNPWLLAALYSLGALGGDAIESFFKRQLNKPSGSTWFPFDQIDFMLGALLTTWPVLHYKPQLLIAILFVMPIGHVLSTIIGHALGLKDKPI